MRHALARLRYWRQVAGRRVASLHATSRTVLKRLLVGLGRQLWRPPVSGREELAKRDDAQAAVGSELQNLLVAGHDGIDSP